MDKRSLIKKDEVRKDVCMVCEDEAAAGNYQ